MRNFAKTCSILALLCAISVLSAAPKVANCPGALGVPAGTGWTAAQWLPCTPAAVMSAPGPGLLVAAQRAAVNQWLASASLLPTDSVYTDTPNPATPSSNWWPEAQVFTGVAACPPIASLTLSWVPPTQSVDGTALSAALASYQIYQGIQPTTLVSTYPVAFPATSFVTPLLCAGDYYFAVTDTLQNGVVSAQSAPPVHGTVVAVTPPPKCPVQPANASQPGACPAGTVGAWTQTHGWTASAYPVCWSPAPWAPAAPPAGACVTSVPAPPTSITVKCTVPVAAGAVACSGTAQ